MIKENCGSYGRHKSWMDAIKEFGKLIEEIDPDQPVKMWLVACAVIGEPNAKTLIKQFLNVGAIDQTGPSERPIQSQEFFVNRQIIEECMFD